MKILLFFTPCLISGSLGSREVTAYAGGGVNIKCRYEDEYKDKTKSFCKIGTNQLCLKQIQTKQISEWSHDGRFSIHDNRSAGFFSVFIRELITEDTGSYGCGVVFDKMEIYTVVKLNVREDLSYEKSISETVHVGGYLTVICKYPESHRSNPKFLCKRNQTAACSYKDSVKESRKNVTRGKFSLYDDRAKQIFSVIVRGVTEQDSGDYWCGAEADWTSDHGYKVYFTRINLTVTDKHKSWSTPSSPPAGFPASSVITVSVILLLLLIGTIILLVVLQKRQKLSAGSASTTGRGSVKDPGNSQGVPLYACEYEEIKDTRRLFASDAGTFTVYAIAHLPTNPCDSGVYSTAQLPTIPSDQDIYSKAQLPTRLSAEESAEDLNYATVSFHTKSTSSDDAAPKVIFKKAVVSCDYDSISHVTSSG
ncbi:hypothetical protein QTP70_004631 [Hemibagrus guttatus]|uniref:Immunoglobulin domain-containing protein n=1 Tax=Hemibagrus guttatus TaxID=175788 RepID=A0AAE0PPD9_9TELE|nr:hypothetical protein QTP70_004631 [Hemibagrus guttatus]